MKIILLKDIKGVGKKYDIKDVSDGYALNLLIPKRLATPATVGALKSLEFDKKRVEAEKKIHGDLLAKNLASIEGVVVTMTETANEKGHLFAAVHTAEIIGPLQEQTRIQINPENIVLEKPIKAVGEYKIEVKAGEKSATFTLNIKAK
ncbi:MAG: 50S ribosomal protein L9 [bacterium]|nr:50S ribosomal protein L9 [bacterium]